MIKRALTLIELIVVIIIVGILAAVGLTQYSLIVEKGRTAEAKVRLGTMRKLAYEYYLNNGTLTGIANKNGVRIILVENKSDPILTPFFPLFFTHLRHP